MVGVTEYPLRPALPFTVFGMECRPVSLQPVTSRKGAHTYVASAVMWRWEVHRQPGGNLKGMDDAIFLSELHAAVLAAREVGHSADVPRAAASGAAGATLCLRRRNLPGLQFLGYLQYLRHHQVTGLRSR